MRPVKKVLKALDDPEEKKNELRCVNYMQECLLEIGLHISKCLEDYKYKIREWESNLRFFISKFTEFGSKILLKIYRRGCYVLLLESRGHNISHALTKYTHNRGLHTTEKLEKNNKVKDRNENKDKVRDKSKEDKKLQQNMESEVSLTSLKRKSRDSDELEKINKKQKTTNSNPGVLLTTQNSIPTTTRSYDQSFNRYDTNYNHHRNRSIPYSWSLKRKSLDSDELEKINKKQKTTNSNPGVLLTTSNSIQTTTRSYDQSSNRYDTNYKHHRNRSTSYSLSLKRKSRDSDELEKINKKQKTTNSNPDVLYTPNSIPTTPPSISNSSNATRSYYDKSSNRCVKNYKHRRNSRSTPYSRSDNRSDIRNENRRLLCITLFKFLSSRNSNSRRETYDNSYCSRPAFREIEREIDSICERMAKLDINSKPVLHIDELVEQLVSMLMNSKF